MIFAYFLSVIPHFFEVQVENNPKINIFSPIIKVFDPPFFKKVAAGGRNPTPPNSRYLYAKRSAKERVKCMAIGRVIEKEEWEYSISVKKKGLPKDLRESAKEGENGAV